MMAIVSPVMIGGMGLGAEAGYWYFTQRKLQHAADVAAHAAGVRKRASDHQAHLATTALTVATSSGFRPATGALALHNPPQSGSHTTDASAVEVILVESHPRLLSSIFSKEPVKIQARAVAKLTGGHPACILGLAHTDPAMAGAITVTGSSAVTLSNCSASSNSVSEQSFYLEGSGQMTADCASSVGGADTASGLKLTCQDNGGEVITYAPPVPDPYKDVPWPVSSGLCTSSSSGGITTISSGGPDRAVYCSLSNLKGTIKFDPGRYIIATGQDFSAQAGATLSGEGVTFFFEGQARVDIAGHADLHLSAPTDPLDPYAGLLFYGEPSVNADGVEHKVLGSSASVLTGAIYMPRSTITYQGNSTVTGSCLQIIADQVTFTGNTAINLGSNCASAGTKPLLMGQMVKLVE